MCVCVKEKFVPFINERRKVAWLKCYICDISGPCHRSQEDTDNMGMCPPCIFLTVGRRPGLLCSLLQLPSFCPCALSVRTKSCVGAGAAILLPVPCSEGLEDGGTVQRLDTACLRRGMGFGAWNRCKNLSASQSHANQ